MNNKLVIFDLDGTLVKGQSQQLFLKYLLRNKQISYFQYSIIILWFVLYKLGLINKPDRIMRYSFGFLKGKSCRDFESICHDFVFTELKKHFYDQSIPTILKHKNANERVIIVSNSIAPLVANVKDYLNVDDYISSELEDANGIYTGEVKSMNYSDFKRKNVEDYISKNKLEITYSYGDHVSDIPVMSMAKFPVAINPERRLLDFATRNEWGILYFN